MLGRTLRAAERTERSKHDADVDCKTHRSNPEARYVPLQAHKSTRDGFARLTWTHRFPGDGCGGYHPLRAKGRVYIDVTNDPVG
jgi:hypothetical protein